MLTPAETALVEDAKTAVETALSRLLLLLSPPPPPPPAGFPAPAAYWKFDDDLADSAAGGANALAGSPSYVAGKYGNAGASATVSKTDQTVLAGQLGGAASWTVGAWMKRPAGFTSTVLALNTAGFGNRIVISISPQFGQYQIKGQVFDQQATSSGPMTDDWHPLFLVNDAGAVTLYLDGVVALTLNASAVAVAIEADWRWDASLNVGMDDVAVWGVALTPEQVAAIATAPGPLSTQL